VTSLRLDELVDHDGILHRQGDAGTSEYRRRWEDEAAEDHVRSAIAGGSSGPVDLAALTAKTSPLWDRLPEGRHFETVLEIGAGYGRIPLYLANARRTTWSTYYAVDIAENMLRELVRYDERFGRNPQASLYPICVSADSLPLENDSVDLALSSAVFLHMGKGFVARAVAEIARTLKPGGHFVFDVSFPNARNPASFHSRLKPHRLRAPNFMKFWTREEVAALLQGSGLGGKAGPTTIEPAGYALVPKQVGPLPVPLARRVNSALGPSPRRLRDVLATTYDAYSTELLD
jgi:arsenite methyltransferase